MTESGRKSRSSTRANLLRTAVAYAVGGWVFVQAADIVLDVFDTPAWVMRAMIALYALGFAAAVALAWVRAKRTPAAAADDHAGSPPMLDRRILLTIMVLLVVGLGLSMYGNLRQPDAAPDVVSILIADFRNATDEQLFSGVIEDFLVVGLEVAPFVNAYSRKSARVLAAEIHGDAGDEVALDAETAMLIALREGIDFVISGSIGRDDDRLQIAVDGISVGDQAPVFSLREQVASQTEVLNAVAAIATELRLELGDTGKPLVAGQQESFAVTNLEAAAEYLKAQDLQLDRRLEEAAVHYRRALELDPDFARAYAGLALTEQYLGNAEAANSNWDETLKRLDRLTERGRLRTLGNYYMINQQNFERALQTYETLIEKYAADNVAYNNLAVTAFYSMDFERAMEVGREVAERHPDHSGYAANYALYAMYASRFEEAIDVAVSILDTDAGSAYAHVVLAMSSAVLGDLDTAEKTYRRMLELDRFARSVGQEGLVDLAMFRGEHALALREIEQAIAMELDIGATHSAALKQVLRAEILVQLEDAETATTALDSAMAHAGGDPAVLVPAALLRIELGDTAAAEQIAVSLAASLSRPKQAYAHALRARIAAHDGDPDAALLHFAAALEIADMWLIRMLRADLYQDTGKTAEAADDWRVCNERKGEAVAVFLNDRPTIRYLGRLDTLSSTTPVAKLSRR